jgi:N-acetyl-anhydromuramyl-L-alanine amidase AmpD
VSDFHRLPIRLPAKYDYGSRRAYPTKAVVFHMAEGTNVARYLSSGKIARGVSVHYTIEQKTSAFGDGEIVRILPEHRISGSIDPDTLRRTNDPHGLYGVKHNRYALGRWWDNPNVAVISVEVAGRAKDGPTERQVAAMVALFEDIDRRYGRVIPLGHRDFQQVKPCPGQTAAIRRAFREMGGHGTDFDQVPERRYMSTRGYISGQVCDVAEGAKLVNYPGGKVIATVDGELTRALLGYSPAGRDYALVTTDLGTGRTAWVRASRIANVRPADTQPGTATAKAAGWESALVHTIGAIEELRVAGPEGV